MNYSFDTGSNLTALGFTFLFLKYLLPVVIVVVLIVGAVLLARYVLNKKRLNVNTGWLVVVLAVIGLLVAISIAS